MACQNPRWGYVRIQGALDNVGCSVSPSTIRDVLKRHGIEPTPERGSKTTWGPFLRAHWELLAATGLFTVEVWTSRGLVKCYVLFTIHLATRRVDFVGITTHPNSAFMMQVARRLTDEFDGPLNDRRYLIMAGKRNSRRSSRRSCAVRVWSQYYVRRGRQIAMHSPSGMCALSRKNT